MKKKITGMEYKINESDEDGESVITVNDAEYEERMVIIDYNSDSITVPYEELRDFASILTETADYYDPQKSPAKKK